MDTAKRKRRRLPWWAVTLIVLFALIIGFLGFSLLMIRFFTGDSLSLQGTLAMASYGGFELPGWYKDLVLNVDRSYPGLPELSNDPDERGGMLDLYERYMYGKTPADGFDTSFKVLGKEIVYGGKAEKQTVRITVSNRHGAFETEMLVLLPNHAKNIPVFIGENFSGNEAALENGEWPFEQILDQGFGVATMGYADWAADDTATYRDGVLRLFDDETLSAYSAWAFGISRGIDYLETLPQVDMSRIASVGHSRLARVSLWAGACDERISLVTGSCGGGLLRSPVMGRITSDGTSNHWYTPEYLTFENRDEELPVDMHTLFALIAGRHLFISIGENDLASDPVSMYDALSIAKTVFRDGYGMEVIPDGSYYDVPVDVPVMSEGVGVNVHSGGHKFDITDWQAYIDYMNAYVPSAPKGITLISEHEGGVLALNDEIVTTYWNMDFAESLAYLRANGFKTTYEAHDGQILQMRWEGGEAPYTLEYAGSPDWTGSTVMQTERDRYSPGTLYPDTEYWWRVTDANGLTSPIGSFVTDDAPRLIRARERIDARGVRNMRDLGGYRTADGKAVRFDMLFRGGQLLYPNNESTYVSTILNDYGRAVIGAIGLRTEIDLRDDSDYGGQEKAAFEGCGYLRVTYRGYTSIFPESAYPETSFADPRSFEAFQRIFAILANEENYPVYFHCRIGQDRTGTLAYLILGLIGVDYETITKDYELTQFSAVCSGMDRKKDWTFTGNGVPPGTHHETAVWETMHSVMLSAYGTGSGRLQDAVANYLITECGITQEQIDSIRRILLTD